MRRLRSSHMDSQKGIQKSSHTCRSAWIHHLQRGYSHRPMTQRSLSYPFCGPDKLTDPNGLTEIGSGSLVLTSAEPLVPPGKSSWHGYALKRASGTQSFARKHTGHTRKTSTSRPVLGQFYTAPSVQVTHVQVWLSLCIHDFVRPLK